MMIKVTLLPAKNVAYIRADQIRAVERNPQNLLATLVGMNIMTPQGFVQYEVMEAPEDIAEAINRHYGTPRSH